jgi:hypothetical protein
MRSSTLAASESYFTIASWFPKETSASLTPFTFSSADCTAVAQEPHVIPLISSVTVSSLASALVEKTSPLVSTTKAANNALRCISHLPRGIISPRAFGILRITPVRSARSLNPWQQSQASFRTATHWAAAEPISVLNAAYKRRLPVHRSAYRHLFPSGRPTGRRFIDGRKRVSEE